MATVYGAVAVMCSPNTGDAWDPPAGQIMLMAGAGGSAGAELVVAAAEVTGEPEVSCAVLAGVGDVDIGAALVHVAAPLADVALVGVGDVKAPPTRRAASPATATTSPARRVARRTQLACPRTN